MISTPEFSRIVSVMDVFPGKIAALPSELTALAERFAFESIEFLEVEYTITEHAFIEGAFVLESHIFSKIIKFGDEKMSIAESFKVTLVDQKLFEVNEEMLESDDLEIIDPKLKEVNVGEIAAQYLSLFVYM